MSDLGSAYDAMATKRKEDSGSDKLLFKEVDDALRADRAAALWHKHKTSIMLFVAALILGTAGNSLWQQYRISQGGKMFAALNENQQLLASGKAADAAHGFKAIAQNARGEVRDLALVWQARAELVANNKPAAIQALQAAVADGHGLWSDIACLRLAGLDSKTAASCLAAKEASPLAATRAEWSAATLWSEGKTADAMVALEAQLTNATLSPEAKARLAQWLGAMKAEQPKPSGN